MESIAHYPLPVTFIIISIWAIQIHLSKKKVSRSFVTTLVAASIAFCAMTPDFGMNIATANHRGSQFANQQQSTVTAKFSPNQGSTRYIVRLIQGAKKSVYVAAYSFTSRPIADALIGAKNRGCDVRVVLDSSHKTAKHSSYSQLKALNIPTRVNGRHAIMHNKFIIIDNQILQTGSFNYTKAAELHNAENIIVLNNQEIIAQYRIQWQKLWDEAK